MAEESSETTYWQAHHSIAIAVLICATLEAGAIIYRKSLPGTFPTSLEIILTLKANPFILGLILGLFKIHKSISTKTTALYIVAILVGLTFEWARLGTLFNYSYPRDEIERLGIWMLPYMFGWKCSFALLGLAIGASLSMAPTSSSTPRLSSESAVSATSIGGYVRDRENERPIWRHPYMFGIALAILGVVSCTVLKFGLLPAQAGMLAFGLSVGQERVQGWKGFLVELGKIQAVILGLLAPLYLLTSLQILFMSQTPLVAVYLMLELLLLGITPWVAGGLLIGWKLLG